MYILGFPAIALAGFVAAVLGVLVWKWDLINAMFADMELFWAERAVWSRTPRRLERPKRRRRKRRRLMTPRRVREQRRKDEEAAVKASLWPYEQ